MRGDYSRRLNKILIYYPIFLSPCTSIMVIKIQSSSHRQQVANRYIVFALHIWVSVAKIVYDLAVNTCQSVVDL